MGKTKKQEMSNFKSIILLIICISTIKSTGNRPRDNEIDRDEYLSDEDRQIFYDNNIPTNNLQNTNSAHNSQNNNQVNNSQNTNSAHNAHYNNVSNNAQNINHTNNAQNNRTRDNELDTEDFMHRDVDNNNSNS